MGGNTLQRPPKHENEGERLLYKAKTEVIGYRNSKNTKRGTTVAIEEGVHNVFRVTVASSLVKSVHYVDSLCPWCM
jgi:hypothetical protein